MRILVTDGMDKGAIEKVRAMGHELVEQFYEPDELGKALRDFDVAIIRSKTKLRAKQIDEAKGSRFKCVIRAGVGLDNIDVQYAKDNGIEVKNTPKSPSESVAELAMGSHVLLRPLHLHRRPHHARGQVGEEGLRQGHRAAGQDPGYRRLRPHRPAAGRDGQGHRHERHRVRYLPHPRHRGELGIPYVEMDELLAKSDFISVHAPAVDGGALINAENIAKMKDGVVIINTSRGTNVDEAALLDALNSGKVRAAGLDVYADEPATNVALYSHPMVSCTPHIGSATVEAQGRIGEELVEIISKM